MKNLIFTLLFLCSIIISSYGNVLVDVNPTEQNDTIGIKDNSGVVELSTLKTLSATHSLNVSEDHLFSAQTNLVPFSTPRLQSSLDDFHEKRAEELMQKVKSENRFVKFLDASALIDLPIGLVSEGGSDDYAILIDSLVITPTHAYLTVYMCIPIPQSERKLIFRGDNIRLSENAGITGDARIFLVNDVMFNLFGKESKMIVRGGKDKTFALWDCNGFKEANVVADIEFSRSWLVPVKGDGNVKSHFETNITNWSDLVVNVSLEPFSLASLKGVEFHTTNAIFDFSDKHTPDQILFPEGYTSPQFIGGDKKLWRGFYMEDLKVVLPSEFKKRDDNSRVSFGAHQMLIDNRGFTGRVDVMNLFTLRQGDMNGWDYSLDSLGLTFVANDLIDAGFNGKIVVPIGEKDKPFVYKAIINPGTSYVFNVQTLEVLDFNIWKAKVLLEENSYLDVQVNNGKFKPKAVLSGSMNVQSETDEMSLFDIAFEELVIMTEAPYLDAKAFSFGSDRLEHTMKGFPISISRIGFRKKGDDKAALFFNIAVHLTGDGDGGFAGDATFDINSVLNPSTRKWKYDGITVSELGVDIDAGSYRIKARIKMFEEDAMYGKGYNGTAELFFQPGFELMGTVIFGKVDGYRYWYADAFVGLPNGIPFCGFLAFYGFGGGMYHNMEQVGFSDNQQYNSGRSLSGIVYKPNNTIRYGFKATIQIGLTSAKETFNGDATFEISFSKDGGLKKISLVGNAYLFMSQDLGSTEAMGALVKNMGEQEDAYGQGEAGDNKTTSGLKPPGKDALISGHLFQYYDFQNDVLHGELELYVDVFGALKGIGPNGLAGWSVMHHSRDEWFIYIGTPDRRIGLKVLGMMTMDGYFMLGDAIPGSPPPPAQVSSILGGMDLDYMRDENALGTGKGVAFGSSFLFDTGDVKFGAFFGRFAMGTGFDVMLKNYGKEVRCKGRSSTLGINGWYANGQAYAFVEGEIGIRVRVFFKKKKIKILSLGAAVVLQTKLPNPFWMKGVVGGRFSVLGGLVKGSCKFELEIGDKCEIIDGSVLEGLNVIADVTPMAGSKDVDVFVSPQAVFNLEIGKEFEMIDVDDVLKKFRIKLDHFIVKDGTEVFEAGLTWNQDRNVAVFENSEILPPTKELTLEVRVSFEESVGGKWEAVKLNGKIVVEEMKTTFKTGIAPDYIPHSNVAYSYPQINQVNFYPKEYQQGYIKLKKGQSYLFESSDVWIQKIKYISSSGEVATTDLTYSNNQVTYNIPANLMNNKVYDLEIANIPKQDKGAVDRNITTTSKKVDGSDVEITSKKAEGNITTLVESKIYHSVLRTSKYNTFNQKMDNMKISQGWLRPDTRGQAVHILGTNITASEYFDNSELNEINGSASLISIVANVNNNEYYNQLIYPLVYEDYTSLTVPAARLEGRDMELGIPPVKATSIYQWPVSHTTFSESEIKSGSSSSTFSSANFIYELPYYMKEDYYELQGKTARFYTYNEKVLNARRRKILETVFPVVTKGNYEVNITYTLPGINKVTTTRVYNIYNAYK